MLPHLFGERAQQEISPKMQTYPYGIAPRAELVYLIAMHLEERQCSKEKFPCMACIQTARTIADIILPVCEKITYRIYDLYCPKPNQDQKFYYIIEKAINQVKDSLLYPLALESLNNEASCMNHISIDPSKGVEIILPAEESKIKRPTKGEY